MSWVNSVQRQFLFNVLLIFHNISWTHLFYKKSECYLLHHVSLDLAVILKEIKRRHRLMPDRQLKHPMSCLAVTFTTQEINSKNQGKDNIILLLS